MTIAVRHGTHFPLKLRPRPPHLSRGCLLRLYSNCNSTKLQGYRTRTRDRCARFKRRRSRSRKRQTSSHGGPPRKNGSSWKLGLLSRRIALARLDRVGNGQARKRTKEPQIAYRTILNATGSPTRKCLLHDESPSRLLSTILIYVLNLFLRMAICDVLGNRSCNFHAFIFSM